MSAVTEKQKMSRQRCRVPLRDCSLSCMSCFCLALQQGIKLHEVSLRGIVQHVKTSFSFLKIKPWADFLFLKTNVKSKNWKMILSGSRGCPLLCSDRGHVFSLESVCQPFRPCIPPFNKASKIPPVSAGWSMEDDWGHPTSLSLSSHFNLTRTEKTYQEGFWDTEEREGQWLGVSADFSFFQVWDEQSV